MKTKKNNTYYVITPHKTKKKPQKMEIIGVEFVVIVLYNTCTIVSLARPYNKMKGEDKSWDFILMIVQVFRSRLELIV